MCDNCREVPTTEQIKLHEELEDVLMRLKESYGGDGDMLGDYCVLASFNEIPTAENPYGRTAIGFYVRPGQAWHRTCGLISVVLD